MTFDEYLRQKLEIDNKSLNLKRICLINYPQKETLQ